MDTADRRQPAFPEVVPVTLRSFGATARGKPGVIRVYMTPPKLAGGRQTRNA
jgi:hypothetical protein